MVNLQQGGRGTFSREDRLVKSKGIPMKKILQAILPFMLFLAACAPSPDTPAGSETPSAPQSGDYIPSPADSALTRGEVYLDSVELLTLESYPLQFMLNVKGNLPTPCHELRIAVSPPDATNRIVVDAYSLADPGGICVQVLEPFEVNFPLGSFPGGHYSVWVNGEKVAEFDA